MTLPIDLSASPAFSGADEQAGSVFFIGNATVLIRYAGFTLLTDPTFVHRHEEVSIGYGMHAKRLTDPALDIHELPPLDLIVLSHFHGDHFDQVAERDLDKSLPIVTTGEAATELDSRGFSNARALATWEAQEFTKGDATLRITALPGRHGPGLTDLALPDVMGSLLEFQRTPDANPYRIYISGDTLIFDDLHEIPRRHADIDLGLFHLGGTKVLGIMVTMDADQGLEALQLVNPRAAIPIHYDDYDVFTSPLSDFLDAAAGAGLEDKVQPIARGETYHFSV